MSWRADSNDRGTASLRVKRRPILTTAMSPPVERIPKRAHHGVGARAALHYCPCGGKLKNGQCVRGCS